MFAEDGRILARGHVIAGFEIGSTHEIVFVRGRRVFTTSVTIARR